MWIFACLDGHLFYDHGARTSMNFAHITDPTLHKEGARCGHVRHVRFAILCTCLFFPRCAGQFMYHVRR